MINTAILMGRLTADPELRKTPADVSVTRFALAVDRSYVPQGGERQTDFIDVVAWRKTAEFVSRYFRKGRLRCKALFKPAAIPISRAANARCLKLWRITYISQSPSGKRHNSLPHCPLVIIMGPISISKR